jgi:hypothetical protein
VEQRLVSDLVHLQRQVAQQADLPGQLEAPKLLQQREQEQEEQQE